MSAGLPLSSPAPSSVAVAMPCPTPAPPAAAAAENQNRPAPLMKKMKLLFARAVSLVFGGKKRASCAALVGSLAVLIAIRVANFRVYPEMDRSWLPLFWAWLFVVLDMVCWHCICYCLDCYQQLFEQWEEAEAEAAVQLPPPPPEMDMC